MPVRAVLFDFGGTLFDYTPQVGAAHAMALELLGFDPASAHVLRARRAAAAEVSRAYAVRPTFLHRDLFRAQLSRTAELLGVEASGALLDQFEDENRRAIIEHMRPRAGAADLLKALREREIYRAVVSNADDDFLGPTLVRNGFDVLLDGWTSSEEARSCKPNTGIYQFALEKAGFGSGETLFVGDSLQHDIVGAIAAGMRTVLVVKERPAPLSDGLDESATADFAIHALMDVVAIIDRLNAPRLLDH